MVGVTRRSVAEHLSKDRGSPCQGRFPLLDHQGCRSFGGHEAVPVGVEGPRRPLGVVVAFGEGLESGEAGHADGGDHGLRAAAHHGVGPAEADLVVGVADGVGRGGAGRDGAAVGALKAVLQGDLAGGHVGDHHRAQVRAHPFRPAVGQHVDLLLQGGQATDTAAVDHSHPVGRARGVQAAALHGLVGGHEGQLGEAVEVAGPSLAEDCLTVEVLHLGRDSNGEVRCVEQGDLRHAGTACHQGPPRLAGTVAHRADHADPGDDHTPLFASHATPFATWDSTCETAGHGSSDGPG